MGLGSTADRQLRGPRPDKPWRNHGRASAPGRHLRHLIAAVDALVDNVFSTTADGLACAVSTAMDDGFCVVAIDDAGRGFSGSEHVERGFSQRGSSGRELDIAARVARDAGGSFEAIRSSLGGARVVMRIPVAD